MFQNNFCFCSSSNQKKVPSAGIWSLGLGETTVPCLLPSSYRWPPFLPLWPPGWSTWPPVPATTGGKERPGAHTEGRKGRKPPPSELQGWGSIVRVVGVLSLEEGKHQSNCLAEIWWNLLGFTVFCQLLYFSSIFFIV